MCFERSKHFQEIFRKCKTQGSSGIAGGLAFGIVIIMVQFVFADHIKIDQGNTTDTSPAGAKSPSGLTPEQREQICNWPPIQRHIARTQDALPIESIVINGISYLGVGSILMVQAKLLYTFPAHPTHAGKTLAYRINFINDCAGLVYAFCVTPDDPRKHDMVPPEDYHVVLITQPRVGWSSAGLLELPAGIITGGDPAEEVKREFLEESIPPQLKGEIPEIDASRICLIGPPLRAHPAMTDMYFPFYYEQGCSREKFTGIHRTLSGSRAGLSQEGELTQVEILPLPEAIRRVNGNGTSCSHHALTRYRSYVVGPRIASVYASLNLADQGLRPARALSRPTSFRTLAA